MEELGKGDSNGKGDQDGFYDVKPSEKKYKINKKINSDRFEIFRSNDNIIDHHTIVFTNIGNARKRDIRKFLETCIERYAIKNNDYIWGKWKINLVVDKFGNKRGIAYVYFKNSEMFNIMIGNNKNGSRRVTPEKNTYYGCDFTFHIPKYRNFSFKQEEYIYVPIKEPLFKIPFLYIKSEDEEKRIPHIIPYHVNVISKANVLVCHHFPEWVTEEILNKKLAIFEERNFSVSIIRNKSNPTIRISFPTNMMATFSLVMIKKIKIKNDIEVCYLFFHLLR